MSNSHSPDTSLIWQVGWQRHMETANKLYLIACNVLYREFSYCISRSKNIVDAKFMPKGLHDMGEAKMKQALQEEIDKAQGYDAILLGYGLCGMGLRGLRSEQKMVVPRAHDCITLLMGSRAAYQEYSKANPGTYFRSTGWVERSQSGIDGKSLTTQLGFQPTLEDYIEQYGEDNGRYLFETLSGAQNYTTLGYIELGIAPEHIEEAQEEAQEKNWEFRRIQGRLDVFQNLVDGIWDDDFLIVEPGKSIQPTHDDDVIKAD